MGLSGPLMMVSGFLIYERSIVVIVVNHDAYVMVVNSGFPLVSFHIPMENHFFKWKTFYKLQFSKQ